MSKKVVIAIVVIAVVLVAVFIPVSSYNGLVSLQAKVEEQSSDIDAQLQRRADLIPNLVSTVKSYTKHEEKVFTALSEARQSLMSAKSMEEKAEADQELKTALNNVIAIAEAYPELKSSELYVSMMDDLEGCENRISYARKEYNGAAKTYNTRCRTFPSAIFAGLFGFEQVSYFEASEGADTVPSVDLE